MWEGKKKNFFFAPPFTNYTISNSSLYNIHCKWNANVMEFGHFVCFVSLEERVTTTYETVEQTTSSSIS